MLKQTTEYTGVHPQKFALWLAMASMTMFFAALTSALIVKKGDNQYWEQFSLPSIFYFSTAAVVGVSVCMQLALRYYRKAAFGLFRNMLMVSSLLAVAFLLLQLGGWYALNQMGKPLTGNLSGSFIYLITGMHGLHLLGGLVVLLIFWFHAFRARKDELYELRNIINPRRQLHLELLVAYWHFVDVVWVYLFIFFLLNY